MITQFTAKGKKQIGKKAETYSFAYESLSKEEVDVINKIISLCYFIPLKDIFSLTTVKSSYSSVLNFYKEAGINKMIIKDLEEKGIIKKIENVCRFGYGIVFDFRTDFGVETNSSQRNVLLEKHTPANEEKNKNFDRLFKHIRII